jgi:F-type H+-transporting ATPase subunit b
MRARLEHGRSALHGGTRTKGREKRIELRFIACLIPGLIAALLWLTAAHASGGGEAGIHEGPNWSNFFWRSVNFLALAGVCYWLLAKKTREFFMGRRDGIRTALAEAVTSRGAAQKQFEEYSAKLDKATGEIDQIGEMIKSQGLAEKARIIDDARKAAEKMKEETRTRMNSTRPPGSSGSRRSASPQRWPKSCSGNISGRRIMKPWSKIISRRW